MNAFKQTTNNATIREIPATKELVDCLLKSNVGNRPLSTRRVDMIARDIASGGWRYNGATIVVSLDGILLDGQHRLAALRKCGYPNVSLLVVTINSTGKDAEQAYYTMDTGKSRSYNDNLAHEGVKNRTTVSAVCRQLVYFESGIQFPTRHELDEIRTRYADGIDFAVSLGRSGAQGVPVPSSAMAAVAMLAQKTGRYDDIASFFTRSIKGIGLEPGQNDYTLFSFLIKQRGKGMVAHHGYSVFAKVAEIVGNELAGRRYANRHGDLSMRMRVTRILVTLSKAA